MTILCQAVCIASLMPLAIAYGSSGDFAAVGGNAPFGLPNSSFRDLSLANATGQVTIPGFNLSSPNPSTAGDGRDWTVEISLQANVPLNSSTDHSLNNAEKKEFTQLISMKLSNLDQNEIAKISSSNKMCGNIVFGLNLNATMDNQDDASKGGKCDFLSEQCQADLQSGAQRGGPDCGSMSIPESCNDWLTGPGQPVTELVTFEFTKALLTGDRFFTLGTEPTSENNDTEYDIAVQNIWPVLFSWSHTANGSGTNTTTTTSVLRCLRPNTISSGSRKPAGDDTEGKGNDTEGNGKGGGDGNTGSNSVPALAATLLFAAIASSLVLL